MKPVFDLLCMRPLFSTVLFLCLGFLFFMGLRFGVFVGGLRGRLVDRSVVTLRVGLLVANKLVFIAVDFLFGFDEL